jgi:hypothetical protein
MLVLGDMDLTNRSKDIIAAAFAANIEDTIKTVQRLLPVTKNNLQMIHASNEDFDSHDFANDASIEKTN